jgi:hypothetical protein
MNSSWSYHIMEYLQEDIVYWGLYLHEQGVGGIFLIQYKLIIHWELNYHRIHIKILQTPLGISPQQSNSTNHNTLMIIAGIASHSCKVCHFPVVLLMKKSVYSVFVGIALQFIWKQKSHLWNSRNSCVQVRSCLISFTFFFHLCLQLCYLLPIRNDKAVSVEEQLGNTQTTYPDRLLQLVKLLMLSSAPMCQKQSTI